MVPARNAINARAQTSWEMTSYYYYPPWKHSHTAFAPWPPLEMLHCFRSVCSSRPVCRSTSCGTTACSPRTAPHTAIPTSSGTISWSVVCTHRTTWRSFPEDHYLAPRILVISTSITISAYYLKIGPGHLLPHTWSSYFITHLRSWSLLNTARQKQEQHPRSITLLLLVASWQSKTATVAARNTG